MTDTDSRDKAIGRHETRFTKYFSDLGYRFDAVVQEYEDSAMYIHPLRMLKAGSPLVKYTALKIMMRINSCGKVLSVSQKFRIC